LGGGRNHERCGGTLIPPVRKSAYGWGTRRGLNMRMKLPKTMTLQELSIISPMACRLFECVCSSINAADNNYEAAIISAWLVKT
jgi:hypothetical protein